MKIDNNLIRENLIFIRSTIYHYSVEEFAKYLDIPKSTYYRLEKEVAPAEYKLEYINKICTYADIPICSFLYTKLTTETLHTYLCEEGGDCTKGGVKRGKAGRPKRSRKISGPLVILVAFFVANAVMSVFSVISIINLNRRQADLAAAAAPYASDNSTGTADVDGEADTQKTQTYYWTASGKKYHIRENCYTIQGSKYPIQSGTLQDAFDNGNDEPCGACIGD